VLARAQDTFLALLIGLSRPLGRACRTGTADSQGSVLRAPLPIVSLRDVFSELSLSLPPPSPRLSPPLPLPLSTYLHLYISTSHANIKSYVREQITN